MALFSRTVVTVFRVLLLFCRLLLVLGSVSYGRNGGGGDESNVSPLELLSYCSADVGALCLQRAELPLSDRDVEDIVHCLNEFGEDQLDPACLNFLTVAESGICNDDAQRICTEYDRPREIVDCLRRHEEQLSASCYQRLFNEMENEYDKEMARRELYYTRATIFITIISIIYLLLPLVTSYWAYQKSVAFSKLYLNPDHIKIYAARRKDNPPVESTSDNFDICFLGVSFWVKKGLDNPKSFFKSATNSMKGLPASDSQLQILRSVSGIFKSSELTAIMGPTGGGKSTLLRLLGGRMNSGVFHGIRAFKGSAMSPSDYDRALRSQGFVSQFDSLFNDLTVWQTMAYGAMLQMPCFHTTLEKMTLAWQLVSELGLVEVANSKVGGDSNYASGDVERMEGISGGQRRLLSIGLTLLSQPDVLFADEPTSGLDSANSLRVIELLHSISRMKNSIVVFSIHQPRPEAFALIDNLILLSGDGQMVYSGPSGEAANFISKCSELELFVLPSYSQNPADFVIDVITVDIKKSQSHVSEAVESDSSIGTKLACHFRTSKEYSTLHHSVVSKIDIPNLTAGDMEENNVAGSSNSPVTSLPGIIHRVLNWTRYDRQYGDYSIVNMNDEIPGEVNVGNRTQQSGYSWRDSFPLHLWVLFSRRITILRPTLRGLITLCAQITLVAVLISVAFSYDVETTLEKPYQIVMLIFLISSFAMIMQYLTLIPEYFVERKIIVMEIANGYIHYVTYILSALLTETPRAVIQTIALNGIVYLIHPLNPNFAQISFCFVCLMVGVSAWQSMLCLCCILSDNINLAYTITFLILGLGSLFGGLLVKLSDIPMIFRFVYHFSMTAVTQRALIVNDLECCYLSVTCSSLIESLNKQGLCPEDFLAEEKGNLGRWTLKDMELSDTPILSLLMLFIANICCRALAIATLYYRETRKYQLKIASGISSEESASNPPGQSIELTSL